MKRIGVLILLLMYLVPAMGVTVSIHQCHGKIASVSLNNLDFGFACTCDKTKSTADCCEDQTAHIKLTTDQQKTIEASFSAFNISVSPLFSISPLDLFTSPILTTLTNREHSPRIGIKHPLYLRHCTLRI